MPRTRVNLIAIAAVAAVLAAVVFVALMWWRVRRRTRRAALANAQAADAAANGTAPAKEDSA